jgi:hypothetical protein
VTAPQVWQMKEERDLAIALASDNQFQERAT